MKVWDSCSDAVISFDKDNMSEDLCRITENSMLVAAITKTLQCELMNCVEVKHCKRVQSCQFPQQYKEGENDTSYQPTTIILDDGCSLETKLLVRPYLKKFDVFVSVICTFCKNIFKSVVDIGFRKVFDNEKLKRISQQSTTVLKHKKLKSYETQQSVSRVNGIIRGISFKLYTSISCLNWLTYTPAP